MRRKRNPCALLVGMQTGAATLENKYGAPFLKKVKNRTTLWSSNCTTGYLPKEYENTNSKGYVHSYVYCSIIYNSQIMKASLMPVNNEWTKKMYIFLHIIWPQNLAICDNMDGVKEYDAGAPGWRSRLSVWLQPGHNLAVRKFEPHVGLWADGSEPGACFRFCVSLSLCPSPIHALSLSQK